jgi:hypothetical protein
MQSSGLSSRAVTRWTEMGQSTGEHEGCCSLQWFTSTRITVFPSVVLKRRTGSVPDFAPKDIDVWEEPPEIVTW